MPACRFIPRRQFAATSQWLGFQQNGAACHSDSERRFLDVGAALGKFEMSIIIKTYFLAIPTPRKRQMPQKMLSNRYGYVQRSAVDARDTSGYKYLTNCVP